MLMSLAFSWMFETACCANAIALIIIYIIAEVIADSFARYAYSFWIKRFEIRE